MTVNHHRNLMAGAIEWAKSSDDIHTQVGCVIVAPSGRQLCAGWNGMPQGVERPLERYERPAKYSWVVHAEERAIGYAAKFGLSCDDCTIYVTHYPCARCAGLIIEAGIKTVIYGPGKTSMPEEEFVIAAQKFADAVIKVHSIDFVVDNNWEI